MVKTLNRHAMASLIAAIVFALAWFAMSLHAHAGCRQFIRGYSYHHAVVAQVVQPLVLYKAGTDLEADALADKVVRLAQQKLKTAAPAPLPLETPIVDLVKQECATCHRAGGKAFDASGGFTKEQWSRWVEMASYGVDVPAEMQAVISKLRANGKGADVTDAVYQSIRKPEEGGGLQ